MKTTSPQLIYKKGFTMIELIVVFTVMAVLSTVGLASFVSYSRSQVLQQATNDFATLLNSAKTRAASQVKPTTQCSSSTVLENYSVTINVSARTYSLNVTCSGNLTVLQTNTLPQNVSFNSTTASPPTTTTNIVFLVLTGGVNGSGNVIISSYSLTKTVTVDSIGGITIQ